jgi:ubiquitin C-terminal hydrolase
MSEFDPPPPPPPPISAGPGAAPAVKQEATGGSSLSALLAKRLKTADDAPETISEAVSRRDYTFFNEKSKTGFVGLSNQGATCYLNSLIQTLFMTPEFRAALYGWHYDQSHGKKDTCIPYQLQKLFVSLQLGDKPIGETTDLTKSFRWTQAAAFQQHDIQELMKVLFEAMEKIFLKGNLQQKNSTPVHQMFEGLLRDYIQCNECKYTRMRTDVFSDLPLVVRDLNTIYDGLSFFSRPELLSDDNRWMCDTCNKKQDALKGLKLHKLPYFLTVLLKRFEFDFATMRRLKLGNKISFPLVLDMNPFVNEGENVNVSIEEAFGIPTGEQLDVDEIKDEPIDMSKYAGKNNIYELYSVLIHSGGAMGGHYYAFIRNFETGKWYKFNDSSVTEIKQSEIMQMFGGDLKKEGNKPSVTNTSFNTNAYMLLYRLYDPNRNINALSSIEIPQYLIDEIKEDNIKYQEAKADWIKRQNNLPLQFFYDNKTFNINIDKNDTVATATKMAHEVAGLIGSSTPLDCVRIRAYNPDTGTVGESFSRTPTATLNELNWTSNKHLYLETKLPGTEFPPDSDEIVIRVIKLNCATLTFEPQQTFKLNHTTTVLEFKQLLSESFNFDISQTLIVKASLDGFTTNLTDDTKQLGKDYQVKDGTTLHVEQCADPKLSIIAAKFEEERNKIQIYYNLLDAREFDQMIAIDKRKSLVELKEEIKSVVGISPSEFILCRNLLGKEYKEERKTLDEVGLFDGSSVFVKKGNPVKLNQVRVTFVPMQQQDVFDLANQFTEILDENIKVEELKALIAAKNIDLPHSNDPAYIRVREKKVSRTSAILFNGNTLKESLPHLKDGQELAFSILDHADTLQPEDMLLSVERWLPSDAQLAPNSLEEIIIKRDSTIGFAKTVIAQLYNVPIQHVCVAKPFLYQLKKELNSLGASLNWYVEDECQLTKMPWYLQDGDLLLWKDDREPEKELPVGQEGASAGYVAPSHRAKESALKIYTMYDDDSELMQQIIEHQLKESEKDATNN